MNIYRYPFILNLIQILTAATVATMSSIKSSNFGGFVLLVYFIPLQIGEHKSGKSPI